MRFNCWLGALLFCSVDGYKGVGWLPVVHRVSRWIRPSTAPLVLYGRIVMINLNSYDTYYGGNMVILKAQNGIVYIHPANKPIPESTREEAVR